MKVGMTRSWNAKMRACQLASCRLMPFSILMLDLCWNSVFLRCCIMFDAGRGWNHPRKQGPKKLGPCRGTCSRQDLWCCNCLRFLVCMLHSIFEKKLSSLMMHGCGQGWPRAGGDADTWNAQAWLTYIAECQHEPCPGPCFGIKRTILEPTMRLPVFSTSFFGGIISFSDTHMAQVGRLRRAGRFGSGTSL